jgi:hypothetical protein
LIARIGAYGRIERSEVTPAWSTVRAIARGLNISMHELDAEVDPHGGRYGAYKRRKR